MCLSCVMLCYAMLGQPHVISVDYALLCRKKGGRACAVMLFMLCGVIYCFSKLSCVQGPT